ncbi:MAG: hypothetical protein JSV42_18060 [Chloroflexota bacterium]|nr:MAG: hypothetical protein JSV42_18060 [Chloroflexota bacterium]
MNNLNYDPGLRQAFNRQTHERLLAESANARVVKSVKTEDLGREVTPKVSISEKIRIIGQTLREVGSNFITSLRADSDIMKV